MTEKDNIWFEAEDVLHIDDAVNHLFGIVKLQDVHLTREEAEALRTLADKAEKYRKGLCMVEMFNDIAKGIRK